MFVILFLSSTFICHGQSDASLQETIDWLKGKLTYGAYLDFPYSEQKMDFDESTKTLILTTIYYDKDDKGNFKYDKHSVRYFPIEKMNPKNIEILNSNGFTYLVFHTNNDSPVIINKIWSEGSAKEYNSVKNALVSKEKEYQIKFTENVLRANENLPERIKAALIHLIKLSGGKGEKF